MRGAGTPQGVWHEILSVGPSCADNTLHKPEVLVIAVIGGITEGSRPAASDRAKRSQRDRRDLPECDGPGLRGA